MGVKEFGRHKIVKEIGRGGMATVYRAHDPRVDRTVAIKVLPRELLHDPKFRARFQREAKTVGRLEHAAIVPVYDTGEQDGQLYIVMRYMKGGSLADRLKHGPVPVQETLKIVERLAGALDFAHSQGIIHRDLKPGNILFDQNGEAYLADFGVAKWKESQSALSGTHGFTGTAAYMSPEQWRAVQSIDGQSDQYALAITIFEALTCKNPFRAPTNEAMMTRHLNDPVPRISTHLKSAPSRLDLILTRALAKSSTDRFPTVGEFSVALSHALKNVKSLEIKDSKHQTNELSDPPLVIEKETIDDRSIDKKKEEAKKTPESINQGEVKGDSKQPKGNRDASSGANAKQLLVRCKYCGDPIILKPREVISALDYIKKMEIDKFTVRCPGCTKRNTIPESRLQHAVSGTNNSANDIILVNPKPPVAKAQKNKALPIKWLFALLLFAVSLTIMNEVSGFSSSFRLTTYDASLTDIELSPNLAIIVTGSNDGTVRTWDMVDKKWIRTNEAIHLGNAVRPKILAFSMDGKLLAYGTSAGSITIVSTSDGSTVNTLNTRRSAEIGELAFSSSASLLASSSHDADISLWLLIDGTLVRTLVHSGEVNALAFSPTDDFLASGSTNGTIRIWRLDGRNLTELMTIVGHSGIVHSLIFSPDGSTLAVGLGFGVTRLYSVADGTLLKTFTDGSANITALAFHPSEEILASGSHLGQISIWNINNGELIGSLAEHSDAVITLVFSPNDSILISGSIDGEVLNWEYP